MCRRPAKFGKIGFVLKLNPTEQKLIVNWRTINLDFDGSIPSQSAVSQKMDEHIDLTAIGPSHRLSSTWSQARELLTLLKRMKAKHPEPWLTFYGSGDFNHVSALLLETLPASVRPLTLVLIDNHPDWFIMPPKYHCGNWVGTAMRAGLIESALLIGQDSDDLKGHSFWFSPWKELVDGKLNIVPYRQGDVAVPLLKAGGTTHGITAFAANKFGTRLHFNTVESLGLPRLTELVGRLLKGSNVYLAIDKDVLSTSYAVTDWEQGQMTLECLLSIVDTIQRHSNLVGIDVCGERAPHELSGLVKRIDAGRIFGGLHGADTSRTTAINQQTNLALLAQITSRNHSPIGRAK